MFEAGIRLIHMIAMLILLTSALITTLALGKRISSEELSPLLKVTGIFWTALIITALSGTALWLWVGKPAAFYNGNPLFHLKLTAFALVLLLAIWPNRIIYRHRTPGVDSLSIPTLSRWSLRLQLVLLLCMPMLAWLLARGIGY